MPYFPHESLKPTRLLYPLIAHIPEVGDHWRANVLQGEIVEGKRVSTPFIE